MSRISFSQNYIQERITQFKDFLASTGDAEHQFRANSFDPAGGEGLWIEIEIPFATFVQLALKFQREKVRRNNISVSLANIAGNEA